MPERILMILDDKYAIPPRDNFIGESENSPQITSPGFAKGEIFRESLIRPAEVRLPHTAAIPARRFSNLDHQPVRLSRFLFNFSIS